MTETDAPRRPGGQPANQNAAKLNFRGSKLPKGCNYISKQIADDRASILADLAVMCGDEIPLYYRALLQTAMRHEQVVKFAERRLRRLEESAPTAEHALLWTTIERASDARDRCLKSMGLDPKDRAKDKDSIFDVPAIEEPECPPA
jgi:hypothetical protein